jgi:small subunit ribosomal protein S20
LAKKSLSVIKRTRQALKRRLTNKTKKIKLRKELKKIKLIKEKETLQKSLPGIQKLIDKSVKQGILHKKTASRVKSRLMKSVKK